MTTTRNVAVLVGSLRKASLNRKLAAALIKLSPEALRSEVIEIGELPLYNQDLEDATEPPTAWTTFRHRIKGFDAVLFVTPEYNRSVPGVLKNALDVGSRPSGKSVWNSKPAAVVSATPGAIGGFGANHHLRQALAFLNMPTCSSRKPISAAPRPCSPRTAASSTTTRASSCAASCRLSQAGSKQRPRLKPQDSAFRQGSPLVAGGDWSA